MGILFLYTAIILNSICLMNVSKQIFYKLINLNKNQLQNSWRFNNNDKEIKFKIQLSKK